jgi:hypothetical protein
MSLSLPPYIHVEYFLSNFSTIFLQGFLTDLFYVLILHQILNRYFLITSITHIAWLLFGNYQIPIPSLRVLSLSFFLTRPTACSLATVSPDPHSSFLLSVHSVQIPFRRRLISSMPAAPPIIGPSSRSVSATYHVARATPSCGLPSPGRLQGGRTHWGSGS